MFWEGFTRVTAHARSRCLFHLDLHAGSIVTYTTPNACCCAILTMTRASRRHSDDLPVFPSAQSRPILDTTRHIRVTFRTFSTGNGLSTLRFVATQPHVNTHRHKHHIDLLPNFTVQNTPPTCCRTLRYSQGDQRPETIKDPVAQCGQPITG